ncbi:DUF308 domain-containing protein [Eubacterium multiforme]|uniref:Uncharacterized membrane protein HdeD (DUF308 family) n=1 Tax=Eubacterium multiforme TaxID=83339 RepID=A0ABT9UR03_9FIRM|nr:DUF308 domain-containing protein [Eubacterium multiforme]MDQ0149078.1 uncharacterized membrane protein HdeD (DUF308 family) [Eubacterium multiforme]
MENMEDLADKLFFAQCIFLGLVGIMFFIFPITSIKYFTIFSGSFIAISGLFKLINSFSIKERVINSIYGILDMFFGLLLVFTNITSIENLVLFYGVWAVVRSIILLFGEIKYKTIGLNFKTIYIIILISIGALIIKYSIVNILLASIFIGSYFIINAICEVFIYLK